MLWRFFTRAQARYLSTLRRGIEAVLPYPEPLSFESGAGWETGTDRVTVDSSCFPITAKSCAFIALEGRCLSLIHGGVIIRSMNKDDSLQMLTAVIGTFGFYYWQHSVAGAVAFASILVLIYAGNGNKKSN